MLSSVIVIILHLKGTRQHRTNTKDNCTHNVIVMIILLKKKQNDVMVLIETAKEIQ